VNGRVCGFLGRVEVTDEQAAPTLMHFTTDTAPPAAGAIERAEDRGKTA
jgi:hypothetical protein